MRCHHRQLLPDGACTACGARPPQDLYVPLNGLLLHRLELARLRRRVARAARAAGGAFEGPERLAWPVPGGFCRPAAWGPEAVEGPPGAVHLINLDCFCREEPYAGQPTTHGPFEALGELAGAALPDACSFRLGRRHVALRGGGALRALARRPQLYAGAAPGPALALLERAGLCLYFFRLGGAPLDLPALLPGLEIVVVDEPASAGRYVLGGAALRPPSLG